MALLFALLLLPWPALLASVAGASVITTAEGGASELLLPVSGVPARFNLSIPQGSVVTAFSLTVATAPSVAPPEVPANVTLDLGLDGVDWQFGGGAAGSFGYQERLADGTSSVSLAVGSGAASFELLVPRAADVSAVRFLATPRVNMSLWNVSEFVTHVQNASAVPVNLSADAGLGLGDLAGDGRIDLVATGADGQLHVYTRLGTSGLLFEDNGSALPPGLAAGRVLMDPVVADIDGDGENDIVVGSAASGLAAFTTRNASARAPLDLVENASLLAGIPAYTNASPAVGDLDGDGDLDLVVGAADGSLVHFRNEIGEGTGIDWRVISTFLGQGLAAPADAAPRLVDLDGDGDLDVVVGAADGSVSFLENTGSAAVPSYRRAGAFSGLVSVGRSRPALLDWSQDGRPDLFYGARSGLVYFAQSLGGLPSDLEVGISGTVATHTAASGTLSGPVAVSLPGSMLAPLGSAMLPLSTDAWGNALETVTVTLGASHFGQVEVSSLEVVYAAQIPLPDMAPAMRAYAQGAVPVGNQTVIPFHLGGVPRVAATAPAVRIFEIRVVLDDAPVFLPLPPLELDEDSAMAHLLDLALFLADEDAGNATYSVLSNSSFVAFAVVDGHFLSADAGAGDFNDNWTGAAVFSLRADDSRGQTATSGPLSLTVVNVEDAPVVEYIPAQYLDPNEVLSLQARAIDGDAGAALRFSLLPPSPSTAYIDPMTGALSWSPSTNERDAPARVVVAVTDGMAADTQAFDVYFVPAAKPVFGSPLPRVTVLGGRPEFLNIFDFATGNTSKVNRVALSGPENVNLSLDQQWLAFDYPSGHPAGQERVNLTVETDAGDESVGVDVEILPAPTALNIVPFPPIPLARGVQHRIELLRFAGRINDYRNLSFQTALSFAIVNGFNLTLYVPSDYAPSSILVPITARAGSETASTTWTVHLAEGGSAPRVGRIAMVAGGARDVNLAYALGSPDLFPGRFPLTTDSGHLAAAGLTSFRISFPRWPAEARAMEYWPIERARVFDAKGLLLLEVELAFDGRSRYIDRVQYFAEDEESVIDGTFSKDEALVGARVANASLAGTGPLAHGPLEPIVRLDGTAGEGWRVSFTRDTALEQLSVVALTDAAAGGGSVSFLVWAVVVARDDAPVYLGGLGDIFVEPGFNKTVALAQYFGDEEGDDLVFALSQSSEGIALDRASGWLVVDGSVSVNLTGVRVVATEFDTPWLGTSSDAINIRVQAASSPPANPPPSVSQPSWTGWLVPLLLLGALTALGAFAVAAMWRRQEEEDEEADRFVDAIVGAVNGDQWESVPHPRPPPTPPPSPDDPQMQLLEAEWSRVIASRHTDATSSPDDSDSEFTGRLKPARPPSGAADAAPAEARPPKMTSSDTESERRAGETDMDIDTKKKRQPR